MVTKLDPIVSEFATQEEADAHDKWFRAKVQASLDDPRPGIPHDQVMAEMTATIARAVARKAAMPARLDQETTMATKLDPIVSEFATQEEADAYDKWFREKVQAALDDPEGYFTHEEVMTEMDQVIADAVTRKNLQSK